MASARQVLTETREVRGDEDGVHWAQVPVLEDGLGLVVGRVQTGVGEKLSILKQYSKLAPCARLSRPQASQPRLDYSAHPP